MAGEREGRRAPRRQVLGVAGLTAVASGTTALVITMGSSPLMSQELLTAPYVDGSTGGPLVVDQPRTAVPAAPSTQAPATIGSADRPGGTGRAVDIAPVPVTPVRRAPAPAPVPAPVPAPAPPVGVPVILPAPADPTPQPTRPGGLPDIPLPGIGNGSGDDGGSGDDNGVPDVTLPGSLPICTIEGHDSNDGGLQLPGDVVRHLQELLCHTTGKPVVVVAKPLKLVPPVVPAVETTVPAPRPGPVHSPKHSVEKRRSAARTSPTREPQRAEAAWWERAQSRHDSASPRRKSTSPRPEVRGHRGERSQQDHGDDHGRSDGHSRGRHRAHHENRSWSTVVRHHELRDAAHWYAGQHRR